MKRYLEVSTAQQARRLAEAIHAHVGPVRGEEQSRGPHAPVGDEPGPGWTMEHCAVEEPDDALPGALLVFTDLAQGADGRTLPIVGRVDLSRAVSERPPRFRRRVSADEPQGGGGRRT